MITHESASSTLYKTIQNQTINRCQPVRYFLSFKTIFREKGVGAGLLSTCTLTAAATYAVAFSYFCLEGTARSIIEVATDETPIIRLRPLGDVGGWTALALFSLLTVKTIGDRLIGEGEYLYLKSICTKWIQDNKSAIEANPENFRHIYKKILDCFEEFNSRCLFSKNLISRHINALEMMQEIPEVEEQDGTLRKDKNLQEIFKNIQTKINNKKSCARAYEGFKSTMQSAGCFRCLSVISLLALPILLFVGVLASIVGEIGLGKQIFADREELTDIGHFGEWPLNIIEALSVAFILIWGMINEGDFKRTRKIYAKQINALGDDDQNLKNRLSNLANKELYELSKGCYYPKTGYRFELL